MAYRQVVEYGMSPTIGHISLPHKRPSEPARRMYSDKLAKMIDEVWMDIRTVWHKVSLFFFLHIQLKITVRGVSDLYGFLTAMLLSMYMFMQEVKNIVDRAYKKTESVLKENVEKLSKVKRTSGVNCLTIYQIPFYSLPFAVSPTN